jgi:hypothetical protein
MGVEDAPKVPRQSDWQPGFTGSPHGFDLTCVTHGIHLRQYPVQSPLHVLSTAAQLANITELGEYVRDN